VKKVQGSGSVSYDATTETLFPVELSSSNIEAVVLTRTPEIVAENHDISFEAHFTLSLAGHTEMLFFRCFCF